MLAVEGPDALGVDELDREMAADDPAGGGRQQTQAFDPLAARATGEALGADASRPRAGLRTRLCPAALGGTELAGRALGVLVVGLDDALDELVAHDVGAAEAHELDALDRVEDLADAISPERWSRGRSTWVMSPVTIIRDPKPRRVRNIFICSGVVFCASSRITKESFRRPPAHEGQRSDLDNVALEVLVDLLGVEHVVQGIEQRPQVGVTFAIRSPGRKPSRSPASTAGRVRMIRLTSWRRERRGGHGDGEEGLAGSRRPDAEGDRVRPDGIDVALLVDGLRRDPQVAVTPNHVLEHAAPGNGAHRGPPSRRRSCPERSDGRGAISSESSPITRSTLFGLRAHRPRA